jgi:hypothetical protein
VRHPSCPLPGVLAVTLAAACASEPRGADDSGPDRAADGGGNGAADAGTAEVRFVAMGDTGTGEDGQYRVAAAVRELCAAEGCDLVLLLGDNLYDAGAESVTDPIWRDAFELPYAGIDVPFYAVLGNHDYGGTLLGAELGGVGNQFERGAVQVAYAERSARWNMPATHYTLRVGPVGMILLDTNSIVWDDVTHGDQRAWWPTALAEIGGAPWRIAAGHHPYRSNGSHGNAGSYEGLDGVDLPIPLPQFSGVDLAAFFDELVCGAVDLYLSGHDHDLEWLEPGPCGTTELVVSGAGAEARGLERTETVARWGDGTSLGFLYVVADERSLTGRFVDETGAVRFEHTLTR